MFQKIEGCWHRKEHFEHYMNNLRCTYSLTVQINITKLFHLLKESGIKAYPAQIYMISSAVNLFPEFRMGVAETGEPGYWDISHPAYTVLNQETKTFSNIWTPYKKDFSLFYKACMGDMAQYSQSTKFSPQKDLPSNVFNISSVPWIDFTAFNLNVFSEGTHLAPIFTIGKYTRENGKVVVPLALQLHHAACDGYHAGQFVEVVKSIAADCKSWL